MKQRVLLGLVVVFCGLVVGCATIGKMVFPSLDGMWKNPNSSMGNTFIFTIDKWSLIQNGFETQSGTFIQTKRTIKFIYEKGGKGEWEQPYTITNNSKHGLILTLKEIPNHNYGDYLKQD
jgi:hypothetical protein